MYVCMYVCVYLESCAVAKTSRFFEPLSSFPTCLHTAVFPVYRSTHACTHPPHLGHASMSIFGCNAEAAGAVGGGEHEQIFAAGLHQHLRPCRSHVCDDGVQVYVCWNAGVCVCYSNARMCMHTCVYMCLRKSEHVCDCVCGCLHAGVCACVHVYICILV
jgi:hypothetical protein